MRFGWRKERRFVGGKDGKGFSMKVHNNKWARFRNGCTTKSITCYHNNVERIKLKTCDAMAKNKNESIVHLQC